MKAILISTLTLGTMAAAALAVAAAQNGTPQAQMAGTSSEEATQGGQNLGSDEERSEIGLKNAEDQHILLDLTDKDRTSVGLGGYIVNNGGCNDCHTWPNFAPGGDPFAREPKQINVASYLAGGRLFGTNPCSRNLTPDPQNGRPAGLVREDFIYVIRTGCDPLGANFRDPSSCDLLQVMPWPLYQIMSERDLNAIYDFLSAIPHQEPGPGAQCIPEPQGALAEE